MIPIRPIGMRIRVSSSPLGTVLRSITWPTGSGKAATCSTAAAIPPRRDSSSFNLSSIADESPFACPAARSLAFASRIWAEAARSAAAAERSAAALTGSSIRASWRCAARPARASSATSDSGSETGCSCVDMRPPYHPVRGLSARIGAGAIRAQGRRFPTGKTPRKRLVVIQVRLARIVNAWIRRRPVRPVAVPPRLGRDKRGPLEKENRRLSSGEPAELVSGARILHALAGPGPLHHDYFPDADYCSGSGRRADRRLGVVDGRDGDPAVPVRSRALVAARARG